jgi:hypothetical protein
MATTPRRIGEVLLGLALPVAFDVNETRLQPQHATPTTIFRIADVEGGAG